MNILGGILIVAGVLWFLGYFLAAGMADKQLTWAQASGKPSLGLLAAAAGLILLLWR